MNLDTSGIDQTHLSSVINEQYGLGITGMTFHPKGETSYSYVATSDGTRYMLKAQEKDRATGLEHVLEAVDELHSERRIHQVVPALRNAQGMFTCAFGTYTVAVFPFHEGATAFQTGLSDQNVAEVAALLASVHLSGDSISVPIQRKETFDNPFEEPILRALDVVATLGPDASPYQQRLRRLLLAEQDGIRAILETMWSLGIRARDLGPKLVLTHGDPNMDNIIIDLSGGLHLVDWDDLAFGPPERDLFAALGSRFEFFLQHYVAAYDEPRLHEEVFAFYVHRWVVQEIADYSTRILFRNSEAGEDEHSWTELTDYLPIRHHELETTMSQIRDALSRILHA